MSRMDKVDFLFKGVWHSCHVQVIAGKIRSVSNVRKLGSKVHYVPAMLYKIKEAYQKEEGK